MEVLLVTFRPGSVDKMFTAMTLHELSGHGMQCEVGVSVQSGQGSQCGMPHSGQGSHRWGRQARILELLPLRGKPVLSRPTCVGVPVSAVTVTASTPTHARSVPSPRVPMEAADGSEQHTVMEQ